MSVLGIFNSHCQLLPTHELLGSNTARQSKAVAVRHPCLSCEHKRRNATLSSMQTGHSYQLIPVQHSYVVEIDAQVKYLSLKFQNWCR